jgi:hypothetical protein
VMEGGDLEMILAAVGGHPGMILTASSGRREGEWARTKTWRNFPLGAPIFLNIPTSGPRRALLK